jgi:TfoX/Sxy family transcriptional regulator of competence genes
MTMAYDERLAERVRKLLAGQRAVEEKRMMGGLTFMVDGKMCVGVLKDDLMARIDPQVRERALARKGCRPMDFTSRQPAGFVFVDPSGTDRDEDLERWIALALDFNPRARASKKPRR